MSPTSLSLRRFALVGAVIALALALSGVLVLTLGGAEDGPPAAGPGESAEPAAPPPLSTPLADYDTTTLVVQREAFCDLIAPEEVAAVVGGEPTDSRTYSNGESAVITSDVTDIAHEFGCRWKQGRKVARAWVFAPPVTPGDAKALVKAARQVEDCDVPRRAPDFGAPSLARTCPAGKGVEASYRGLFGDAWLACSLTAPGAPDAVLEKAGAWCVAAARAASQPAA